ncbi:MAG: argininosuccinate lyase [Elusimicrobiota bacterium]
MILRKGRLTREKLEKISSFTSSLKEDYPLAEYDIKQSIVHAKALSKAGIITSKQKKEIVEGLKKIRTKLKEDSRFFQKSGNYEDIHMAIEEKLGKLGKKLHAGRSRNDQVACDMRMFVMNAVDELIHGLENAVDTLRERDKDVGGGKILMPAFTHLQHAQAVDLSTYLGVFRNWFTRDIQRLKDLKKRVSILPLGSAAGASTNIKLDLEFIAGELGFREVAQNSMDAVSSRDYIMEFAGALAVIGVHFSRMAEDFIIYSSSEFFYIQFDQSIADTSSIMPQKKNPDVLELIRGSAARLISTANEIAVLMKGLPLTYNRDMQNDKEIIRASRLCTEIADIIPDILKNIEFNREKMEDEARYGFTDAADMAEYLVLEGMEFRTAHEKVGKLVSRGIEKNCSNLSELSLKEMREVIPGIKEDVFDFIEVKNAVSRRLHDEK